jgi:MOSC domain-containing protein YiiM
MPMPVALADAEQDGQAGARVGTIAGIARHAAPRAPMEVLDRAEVSVEAGIAGDHRGRRRAGSTGKRQVTLMERRDWEAAAAQVDHCLPWQERRANLLVDGLDLPQVPGTRLRIGDVVLEITCECDPCQRMDALVPGLFAALLPDWRGGACTRVLVGGTIAVGDTIRIET